MEITIKQSKLAKALNMVSRVAGGSSIGGPMLPILNNVLIRVRDGRVSLTTTNLEMAIVEYVQPEEFKDGEITVPAKLLADFVSNLPKDEQIKISNDGNKITVKAGKYSSVLNSIDSEEFPELPEIDENKVVIFKSDITEFKQAVSQVIVACSNNTTRPVLTGVYFNTFENALYLAATDGYRLTEKKFINNVQSEVKAVVPASSLQEVLRSITDEDEEIEIWFDEMQVRFRMGEVEITSKLLDGSYVDYRGLIPKETKISTELDRAELVRVTKLAALFARASGGTINCESNSERGVLSIAAVANEFGENNSEIESEVQENAKVAFNSKFLLDALNVLGEDRVKFGFSEKITPIVVRSVKNNDYVHVIMPQH